jgi:hypothetical protein
LALPSNNKKHKECFMTQEKLGPGTLACKFEILIPISNLNSGLNPTQAISAFDAMPKFQQHHNADETFRGYGLNDNKFSCSVSEWGSGPSARIEILCNANATKPIY